jgi:hypothetical protein
MDNAKTYHGSCECGQVQYEAKIDLSKGTFKCNCRMCTKTRFWAAGIPGDDLKVTAGEELLTRYWSNPVHHFCKVCGIKVFGKGKMPDGKIFAAITLATLDDLDPREWVKAPVMVHDGIHDRFGHPAEFAEHL